MVSESMREVYTRNVASLQFYIAVMNQDCDFNRGCSYPLRSVGQTIPEIIGGSNEINEYKHFFEFFDLYNNLLLSPVINNFIL